MNYLNYSISLTPHNHHPLLESHDSSTTEHPVEMRPRHANNGVSWYPSYQKLFKLAENFEQIWPTLSKLQKNPLTFLKILPNFPKIFAKISKTRQYFFLNHRRKFNLKSWGLYFAENFFRFCQGTKKVRIIWRPAETSL